MAKGDAGGNFDARRRAAKPVTGNAGDDNVVKAILQPAPVKPREKPDTAIVRKTLTRAAKKRAIPVPREKPRTLVDYVKSGLPGAMNTEARKERLRPSVGVQSGNRSDLGNVGESYTFGDWSPTGEGLGFEDKMKKRYSRKRLTSTLPTPGVTSIESLVARDLNAASENEGGYGLGRRRRI